MAEQTSSTAIETSGLTHRYKKASRSALEALDLQVQPGEIFGILGPNGGGKTTLFRILATLLKPTSGTAAVFGINPQADAAAVRRQLGIVFQSPSIDDQLTAREQLTCQGGLYGLKSDESQRRGLAWLDRFGLADRAEERLERYSGGMRRRLEIAKALIHKPRLLLMDEPSAGLDPSAQRQMWTDLQRLRHEQGLTILVTTHLMAEAERCDRLAILSEGHKVAVDRPARLKAMIGGEVITLEPMHDSSGQADDEQADSQAALQSLADEVARVLGTEEAVEPRIVDERIQVEHKQAGANVAALFHAMPNRFQSITVSQPTLEDVFVRLTGSSMDQAQLEED